MPSARACDPPRADLALLRDVAPELVDVLVVDLVDLVLAEEAGLAAAGASLFVPPLSTRRRSSAVALSLCHRSPQNGMSSSTPQADPKSGAVSAAPPPSGMNW